MADASASGGATTDTGNGAGVGDGTASPAEGASSEGPSVATVNVGVKLTGGKGAAEGLSKDLKFIVDYFLKASALRSKNKEIQKQERIESERSAKSHQSMWKSVFLGNMWLKESQKLWHAIRGEIKGSQDSLIKMSQYSARTGSSIGSLIGGGVEAAAYGGNWMTAAQDRDAVGGLMANLRMGESFDRISRAMQMLAVAQTKHRLEYRPGMTPRDVGDQLTKIIPELMARGENQYARMILETLGLNPNTNLGRFAKGENPFDDKPLYEPSEEDNEAARELAKSNAALQAAIENFGRGFNTATADIRTTFAGLEKRLLDFASGKLFGKDGVATRLANRGKEYAAEQLESQIDRKVVEKHGVRGEVLEARRTIELAQHNLEKAKVAKETGGEYVPDYAVYVGRGENKGTETKFVPSDSPVSDGTDENGNARTTTLKNKLRRQRITAFSQNYGPLSELKDSTQAAQEMTMTAEAAAALIALGIGAKVAPAAGGMVKAMIPKSAGAAELFKSALALQAANAAGTAVGKVSGPLKVVGGGAAGVFLNELYKHHKSMSDFMKYAESGKWQTEEGFLQDVWEESGEDPEKAKKIIQDLAAESKKYGNTNRGSWWDRMWIAGPKDVGSLLEEKQLRGGSPVTGTYLTTYVESEFDAFVEKKMNSGSEDSKGSEDARVKTDDAGRSQWLKSRGIVPEKGYEWARESRETLYRNALELSKGDVGRAKEYVLGVAGQMEEEAVKTEEVGGEGSEAQAERFRALALDIKKGLVRRPVRFRKGREGVSVPVEYGPSALEGMAETYVDEYAFNTRPHYDIGSGKYVPVSFNGKEVGDDGVSYAAAQGSLTVEPTRNSSIDAVIKELNETIARSGKVISDSLGKIDDIEVKRQDLVKIEVSLKGGQPKELGKDGEVTVEGNGMEATFSSSTVEINGAEPGFFNGAVPQGANE